MLSRRIYTTPRILATVDRYPGRRARHSDGPDILMNDDNRHNTPKNDDSLRTMDAFRERGCP
jgi:hypothetical protein